MTKAKLKKLYQEYLDNFDPTPQYAYDDWLTPLDFDDFSELILVDENPN